MCCIGGWSECKLYRAITSTLQILLLWNWMHEFIQLKLDFADWGRKATPPPGNQVREEIRQYNQVTKANGELSTQRQQSVEYKAQSRAGPLHSAQTVIKGMKGSFPPKLVLNSCTLKAFMHRLIGRGFNIKDAASFYSRITPFSTTCLSLKAPWIFILKCLSHVSLLVWLAWTYCKNVFFMNSIALSGEVDLSGGLSC